MSSSIDNGVQRSNPTHTNSRSGRRTTRLIPRALADENLNQTEYIISAVIEKAKHPDQAITEEKIGRMKKVLPRPHRSHII